MQVIEITVPYPPSSNRYWRVDRGTTHLTAAARRYKQDVAALAHEAGVRAPIAGPVAVELHVYRPRRAGDLDNRIKLLLDSLQGAVLSNDSQVTEIHAYRHDDKARPRVEVTVAEADAAGLVLLKARNVNRVEAGAIVDLMDVVLEEGGE
jgi:crossover junction endodeoxyribonuclease RusA